MKFREVLCRSAVGAMAALSAALLVACGGGERVDPFSPEKIVAFGDDPYPGPARARGPAMSIA